MVVNKHWIWRIILFLVGIWIMALGINVNIMAAFGVGGWDAFNIVMNQKSGLSIGTWLNIDAAFYIMIAALLRKKRPRFETILTSFLLGIFVDLWGFLFQHFTISNWFLSFFWFMIAITTIAFGAGIYLVAKLPPNPIDDLMLAVTERFACSITIAKLSRADWDRHNFNDDNIWRDDSIFLSKNCHNCRTVCNCMSLLMFFL